MFACINSKILVSIPIHIIIEYLWVVCGDQVMPDAKEFHYFIIQLIDEFSPLVTGENLRQSHAHEDLHAQP